MLFRSLLAAAALAAANASQAYTPFADKMCHGYADIPAGRLSRGSAITVAECQAVCEKNSTCVSFYIRTHKESGAAYCVSSSRCAPALGITLSDSSAHTTYQWTTYVRSEMTTFKIEAPTGYTLIKDAGCLGHDNLDVFARTRTPSECVEECTKNSACISVEWSTKYNYCYMSSTCAQANGLTYYAYTDRYLFVDSTKNTYPTAVPAGYKLQTDMQCSYRDDVSMTQYTETLTSCAAHCTSDTDCVSFEWTGRDRGIARCYLSKTCAPSKGVVATKRTDVDLYTKTKEVTPYSAVPEGFTAQLGRHCYHRNEMKEDRTRSMTIQSCAAECRANTECVSFEWTNLVNGNYCQLSTTCAPALGVKAALTASYYQEDLYIKSKHMTYQTTVPAGYVLRTDTSCPSRDDTEERYTETLDSCAKLCRDDATCVSFEWTGRSEGYSRCFMSSTCSPSNGVTPRFTHDVDLYVKAGHNTYTDIVPTGYTLHKHTQCSGRNAGSPAHYSTVRECSDRCNAHKGCVSFGWNGRTFGAGSCTISETCAKSTGVTPNENHVYYDLYVKTEHDVYPTTTPAGFTLKKDNHCSGYDASSTVFLDTIDSCASKCAADAKCLSFEWDRRMGYGGRCYTSDKCAPSKGVFSTVLVGVNLYIKSSETTYVGDVAGFQRYENKQCHGLNDAGTFSRTESLESCAARCATMGDRCVSFEWNGRRGYNVCYLSKTCSAKLGVTYSNYDATDLYVKDAFKGDAAVVGSTYYSVSAMVPTGFKLQQDKICHRRDLGLTNANGGAITTAANGVETLAGCAQKCRDLGADCVSFEWSGRSVHHTYCWLSRTCAPAFGMVPTNTAGRDVYIKAEFNAYATVVPAGYTLQKDSACHYKRFDLGAFVYTETIQSCAAKCDAMKECVTYQWDGRRSGSTCKLSSTCAPSKGTSLNENAYGYDVYTKTAEMAYTTVVPSGYELQKDVYCYQRDDDRFTGYDVQTLESCAALCRANSTCVSFEWDGRRPAGGYCFTSSTCSPSHGVLPTQRKMYDLYVKKSELALTIVTPTHYTKLADTYCRGTTIISRAYSETVESCSGKCNVDSSCVSFTWHGRNEQTHATCTLTSNCAKAKSAVYYTSKRTDLFVKDMFAGTAWPTSAPTMQPTFGAKECVIVTRPVGWTVPASCDTTKCRDWDCKSWCTCYTSEDDAVYARNGCDTDDGKPCNCAMYK